MQVLVVPSSPAYVWEAVQQPPSVIEHEYQRFRRDAKFAAVLPLALLIGFSVQAALGGAETSTIVAYAIISLAALRSAWISPRFADMFIGLLSPRQTLLFGVGLGLMLPFAAILITMAAKAISPSLVASVAVPGLISETPLPFSGWFLVLPLLFAPIAETAIIQVWIQSQFSRYPWISLCIGTLCFAAIHLQINPMIVFTSVGLSALRAFSRSAGCVLVAHVVANGTVFALLVLSHR